MSATATSWHRSPPAVGADRGSVAGVVKKTLVVAVVVLLVVIGLPVLMPGMGSAHCADCGPATLAGAMCLAVLAAAAFAAARSASRRARLEPAAHPGLLRAVVLERPPQFAFVR